MLKARRLLPKIFHLRYGLNRQSPLSAAHRHWVTFLRYNSWRKMVNLILILTQFVLKRPVVKGYPFILKVEPTSRCNLKCPGCIAHGTDFPIEDGDMSLKLFQELCDELGDYLYKISLYITGEPLLNNQIYDMIGYATKKRIGKVISTNFHAFNEGKAEKMISSGLSHIIVCLDGVSQEVYGKYRLGGKVELVLKNLDILVEKKMKMRSRLPFIEIQAIRNGYNEKELPLIGELARKLKVDRFTIREDLRGYKAAKQDRTCFWLWFTSLVTEKGIILPCCASAWWVNKKREFGNVNMNSFRDTWNNEKYRKARELFCRKGNKAGRGNSVDSLCFECNIFRCQR